MTRDAAEVFSRWRRWSHPRAISIASATKRWMATSIALQIIHPLAMVATGRSKMSAVIRSPRLASIPCRLHSSIASATTRWLAAIDLLTDHPPSGDGGYRLGCDRSPYRSSTIWRWWLQTGLHRSPYRSSTIWRWIATNWVALATTPLVASATVHESPCDGLPPPDAMRPNSTQPPDLG